MQIRPPQDWQRWQLKTALLPSQNARREARIGGIAHLSARILDHQLRLQKRFQPIKNLLRKAPDTKQDPCPRKKSRTHLSTIARGASHQQNCMFLQALYSRALQGFRAPPTFCRPAFSGSHVWASLGDTAVLPLGLGHPEVYCWVLECRPPWRRRME